MTVITAKLWVCDNCGSYYGSSSVAHLDLRQEWNTTVNNQQLTHRRSRCPTKQCADKDIQRRPVTVPIQLQVTTPPLLQK